MSRAALALLLGVAVLSGGCGGAPRRSTARITRSGRAAASAPAETVAEAPEAAPAAAPGAPTDERPALETREGRASYYADRFEGRSTASGEPYRARELTAASRDLPFGTIVRVIRVDTGAAVVVRVNDRGPFGDERRILDLSRAAAEALDMIRAGVIEIRAEILERGAGRRGR